MNRTIPCLLLALLAGCVANVVGPTGAPLTNAEIEQLAAHELMRGDASTCTWRHPGADSGSTGTHERRCTAPGAPADTASARVEYTAAPRGRREFRINDRFVAERCRIVRRSAGELGVLRCWTESRY